MISTTAEVAVGFTETVYTVNEGDGNVDVCVRLEEGSELGTELILQLQTHNGTALGKLSLSHYSTTYKQNRIIYSCSRGGLYRNV